MKLPSLLVVTDGHASRAAGRPLVDTVGRAARAGARGFLFREKDLEPTVRIPLARTMATVLPDDAVLIIASDPRLAQVVGAPGVHLSSTDSGVDTDLTVGRSCHDLSEIAAAAEEQVDYITLSPVFESLSKPGHGPGLGVDRFRGLAASFPGPVYALGGITSGRARPLIEGGAHGVAVAGAVMSAPDPAAVTAKLLDELEAVS